MSDDSFQARRERFIAAALAGLNANPQYSEWTVETCARTAILNADAVMALLDPKPEKE